MQPLETRAIEAGIEAMARATRSSGCDWVKLASASKRVVITCDYIINLTYRDFKCYICIIMCVYIDYLHIYIYILLFIIYTMYYVILAFEQEFGL